MTNNIVKVEFEGRIEYHNEQGQKHRLDGPAVEWADGDREWYQKGQLHRDSGPAIERANGTKYWYLEGKRYSEEEFLNRRR